MKKLIIYIALALFFVSVLYKYQYVDTYKVDSRDLNTKSQNVNIDNIQYNELTLNDNDRKLQDIADNIKPLSDEILKEVWENEFGCAINKSCNFTMLNAKTLKEALWMKRKGYLSRSIIEQLNNISKKDLAIIASHGNINAKKMMAIYAMRKGNTKLAKSYASNASAHEYGYETFSMRLVAQALLMENKPMRAAVELRMASLLGDNEATLEYYNITRNSSREAVGNTNLLAYRFLSSKYKNQPLNQWDEDSRPDGDG